MSRRTEMLGSTIQRELAEMIQRDLVDPRLIGFPSITHVKVTPDLATADVYVTVMGTPGQQTAALNALRHSAGLMRTKLTKVLSLRVAPFIKFHIDENLRKEIAVLELIRKANEEMAERNPPPADDFNGDEPAEGHSEPAATEPAETEAAKTEAAEPEAAETEAATTEPAMTERAVNEPGETE